MCAVDPPVECGAYKCGAVECLTACVSDADCTEGNRCTGQKCGSGARCSDDLTSVLDADGNATSCSPFLCQGQACLKACSVSTDCADGYVCNSDNQQCEASTTKAPTDSSGCGCRAAGGRAGGGFPLLVGVALLALGGARRRRAA
jgi:MYXO-CTERM domain-containing protein